jgi:Arc/MetJ-type ribon-helix-helix transcriptional regulator
MIRKYSDTVERLIREQMSSGRYSSEDELMQTALEALEYEVLELRAIQVGLDSFELGDPGIALDEAFENLHRKFD